MMIECIAIEELCKRSFLFRAREESAVPENDLQRHPRDTSPR